MSDRRRFILLSLLAASVAAGCGTNVGAPKAASTQADATSSLYSGMVVAAGVVGLLVWGLIAWSLIRYRRGRRSVGAVPSQRAYNIPLEVLYTVVPILIVAVLFVVSLQTERKVTHVSDRPDVKVQVIGYQWQWQFRYPDDGILVTAASDGEPPELVLPVGQTIELRLVTRDVNHSFWVPRFLSKRDLIPGVRNVINVNPTKVGSFVGRCAEFCGLDHWRMNFKVKVVSEPDYRAWRAAKQRGDP